MTQKVVILTAGAGSRLNERTKFFNKALLKLGDKAAISHILDLFPKETEFVIALGYLGNIVQQYLEIAHPDLQFHYVEIDKYSVPGAGPAYALEKCKGHLQEPFYFVACDTIIESSSFHHYNTTSEDFVAYDLIERVDADRYCTLHIEDGQVIEWIDKLPGGTDKAFTGFAHVKSSNEFWSAMERNRSLIHQELQLSPVFAQLKNVRGVHMKWHDVGSEQGLLSARKVFKGIDNLDKLDEELYVVNKQVVKYFYDENIVAKRIKRTDSLGTLVPNLTATSKNFYRYNFIYGDDLFQRNDIADLLPKLLDYAQQHLWLKPKHVDLDEFMGACDLFYRQKTLQRIEKFYKKTSVTDAQDAINCYPTQNIGYYMALINWWHLCEGAVPSGFHGDFQPANVVVDFAKEFKLIDWRQDFGGIQEYGDRYYDFAKLYASLLMPHPSIKEGRYSLSKSRGEIFLDVYIPDNIKEAKALFESWLTTHGYSIKRTQLLTAIVLLNMAALHEHPLDQWLYYFAKSLLSQIYPAEMHLL